MLRLSSAMVRSSVVRYATPLPHYSREPSSSLRAPRQGHGGPADGTFLALLIFRSNVAVEQVEAIFFVLVDDDARAGDGVPGARHRTIAHTKFLQRQRGREPIGQQLCQPASGQ